MEEKKITIEYKPRKRVHFIDKMYRINLAFAVFVTLFILGLMAFSAFVEHIDLSPAAYIIAPIWVEVGAFSLANIKKHEKENRKENTYGYTGTATGVSCEDNSVGASRYEEN